MKRQIKVIADANIPFLPGVLDPYAEVRYLPSSEIHRESIRGSDALFIRTRTRCGPQLLDGSGIKFIATASIGFDHIDTHYCESRHITWVHAPGCNSWSVTQYVASALLTVARTKNFDLSRMTIGIVGVGNVGRKVAGLAQSLGLRVFLNDPPRMRTEGRDGFVDLDELMTESDIISFHVPLIHDGVDKTQHMADESFFAKLGHKAVLLNTSRGPVVETRALKDALRKGNIDACVLDVWENEPDIDRELLDAVDIATPHIAGYSADGKANGTAVCVREMNSFFHLGMDENWYPAEIPSPSDSRDLVLDCRGKKKPEIISEAVLATYSVLRDDETLRESVATFERQRNGYPVRREFPFYRVTLLHGSEDIRRTLADLGFSGSETDPQISQNEPGA